MKFKKGDKLIVCGKLKTPIEKVTFNNKKTFYWFRDEKGKLFHSIVEDLELFETETNLQTELLINCNCKNPNAGIWANDLKQWICDQCDKPINL